MTCVNDYHKYIPSERAFDHGCYEVDSRLYPKGTAEQLAQTLVELLSQEDAEYGIFSINILHYKLPLVNALLQLSFGKIDFVVIELF